MQYDPCSVALSQISICTLSTFPLSVLKDLLKREIEEKTFLCVIITARSRMALHPSLVASRGTHYIQGMCDLDSPNEVYNNSISLFILVVRFKLTVWH